MLEFLHVAGFHEHDQIFSHGGRSVLGEVFLPEGLRLDFSSRHFGQRHHIRIGLLKFCGDDVPTGKFSATCIPEG